MNHYEVLGLSATADIGAIKKSYRKKALKQHPDKVPANERLQAEEAMKLLNEAFFILSDPERRTAYDRKLKDETDRKMGRASATSATSATSAAGAATAERRRRQEAAAAEKREREEADAEEADARAKAAFQVIFNRAKVGNLTSFSLLQRIVENEINKSPRLSVAKHCDNQELIQFLVTKNQSMGNERSYIYWLIVLSNRSTEACDTLVSFLNTRYAHNSGPALSEDRLLEMYQLSKKSYLKANFYFYLAKQFSAYPAHYDEMLECYLKAARSGLEEARSFLLNQFEVETSKEKKAVLARYIAESYNEENLDRKFKWEKTALLLGDVYLLHQHYAEALGEEALQKINSVKNTANDHVYREYLSEASHINFHDFPGTVPVSNSLRSGYRLFCSELIFITRFVSGSGAFRPIYDSRSLEKQARHMFWLNESAVNTLVLTEGRCLYRNDVDRYLESIEVVLSEAAYFLTPTYQLQLSLDKSKSFMPKEISGRLMRCYRVGLKNPATAKLALRDLKLLSENMSMPVQLRLSAIRLISKYNYNPSLIAKSTVNARRAEFIARKALVHPLTLAEALRWQYQALILGHEKSQKKIHQLIGGYEKEFMPNKFAIALMSSSYQLALAIKRLHGASDKIALQRVDILKSTLNSFLDELATLLASKAGDYGKTAAVVNQRCKEISVSQFLSNKSLFGENRGWARAIYSVVINLLFIVSTGLVLGPLIRSLYGSSPFVGSGLFKATQTRTQGYVNAALKVSEMDWNSEYHP